MRRKTGNRFLVVFLIVTMLISMAPAGVFAADIPEAQTVSEITGSGTEADPYLISDGRQLSSLGGTTLTGCYRLTADIDMEGIDMRPINGCSIQRLRLWRWRTGRKNKRRCEYQ